jgi:hypothetical protein
MKARKLKPKPRTPKKQGGGSSSRRRARYTASNRDSTRVILTRWLTYRTPAQLIKDAKALVPEWKAHRVTLFDVGSSSRRPRHLDLSFGRGADDYYYSVTVVLRKQDVPALLLYLLRQDVIETIWINAAMPDTDGDGGEELDLPTISQAELAAMAPASQGVQ